MKRLFIIICFFAAMQPVARAQEVSITYQQFYNELEPYGRWINYPSYGYVWAPYFERPDYFTPYSSGGHWVYTDYGWTWVSDYEWGWATFHYGRWFYDDYLGWCWIPGYEWAPAWVTWGSYGGNYGWAPLGPGISISVGMRWRPPHNYWWTFVPCNRFGGSDWNRYIVRNNTTIVSHVTIINNVYKGPGAGRRPGGWMRGPKREEVARITHRPVQPVAFNNVSRPEATRVQNNRLSIYRPTVNRNPSGANIRPGRAEALSTARPESRLPMHSQDRHNNNPGNNRPAARPANPQPPSRPGNPETPGNPARPPGRDRPDRPDCPYPNNPRPETKPVKPGTRPESRPGNPPPQQDNKPPVPPPPGNRPAPRPDRPTPERPASRPPNRPAQPGNRPANPQPPSRPGNPGTPHNRPDHPAVPPTNRPPGNRPAMPPTHNPGAPPPNRPAAPPEHREQHHDAPPPVRPPGRKDDGKK